MSTAQIKEMGFEWDDDLKAWSLVVPNATVDDVVKYQKKLNALQLRYTLEIHNAKEVKQRHAQMTVLTVRNLTLVNRWLNTNDTN